jgi:hypothetical protein
MARSHPRTLNALFQRTNNFPDNKQQHKNMKNHHTPITRLGTIALAAIITTGAVSAASTSDKDGMMQTTTDPNNTGFAGNGLPMLAPGVQELSFSGRLNWETSTAYSFDISYGRFITSNWLVGVQGGITGINSDKDYRVGVFGEYNFLTGTKWVPFVRAGVGYSRPDIGSDSAVIGLDAGVKYFMRSNLAIFASVGGDWVISGNGGNDGFAKQIDLGLKFYF